LNASWDLRILVATSFEESRRRARLRDIETLGSVTRVEERFRNRYLPSQEYYFETVVPGDLAEVIVENENPEWPSWLIRSN
jgi:uridine kinase